MCLSTIGVITVTKPSSILNSWRNILFFTLMVSACCRCGSYVTLSCLLFDIRVQWVDNSEFNTVIACKTCGYLMVEPCKPCKRLNMLQSANYLLFFLFKLLSAVKGIKLTNLTQHDYNVITCLQVTCLDACCSIEGFYCSLILLSMCKRCTVIRFMCAASVMKLAGGSIPSDVISRWLPCNYHRY